MRIEEVEISKDVELYFNGSSDSYGIDITEGTRSFSIDKGEYSENFIFVTSELSDEETAEGLRLLADRLENKPSLDSRCILEQAEMIMSNPHATEDEVVFAKGVIEAFKTVFNI